VIPHGVEIFVAVDPVDMRFGFERLGGVARERVGREPRSKALFVFCGRRRQTWKLLYWDGTGVVPVTKRLDRGLFEMPIAERGSASVVLSDAAFEALFAGLTTHVVH